MTESGIASRYSQALVDALTAPAAGMDAREALSGLTAFVNAMDGSRDLELILFSPSISQQRKRAVLGRVADRLEVSKLVRNFLFVLSDHRRLPLIREIAEQAYLTLDQRLGFLRADVTAAAPLSDEEKWLMAEQFGALTGKQIRMEITIDPDLIGGVVARVGSMIYDGSVRGRLRAINERLTSGDAVAGSR